MAILPSHSSFIPLSLGTRGTEMVCWMYSFLWNFDLMKRGKRISRHILVKAWEEWAEDWHHDVSCPPSELIRFWCQPLIYDQLLIKWNETNIVFPTIILTMIGRFSYNNNMISQAWNADHVFESKGGGGQCWGVCGGIFPMFKIKFCLVLARALWVHFTCE